MKYIETLWQQVMLTAKVKKESKLWAYMGVNPRTMQGNKKMRLDYMKFVINAYTLIRAIDADKCPQCFEIIPDRKGDNLFVSPEEGLFCCPECGAVIQDSRGV